VRAETRHQMKEDRFNQVTMEAWDRLVEWSLANRTLLIVIIAVAVVVICGAFGGWYYLDQQDQQASLELNKAVRTMSMPIRPSGMPAQADYPSFASSQERATAARRQLEEVVSQFPHTRSADFAHYLIGTTEVDLNNTSAAEKDYLSVSKSSNDDLAALAKFALASVYRSTNRVKDAIALYQQLISKPTRSVGKATAQLELAAAYQENNQSLDAKKTYMEVQKDNPNTPFAQTAMTKLEDLK
jgi:TolA-binding protein